MEIDPKGEMLELTTEIVSAYVSNNPVPSTGLADLIQSVHGTLTDLATEAEAEVRPDPAVPPSKSVTPDFLICLEDGKKLKMLKRYIRTRYGLTPDEYRARWNLPGDYPMVAPNYAKVRSQKAKEIGLGRKANKKT
ncbi:MAG: MucR family transcriptional regulator [Pseudomonadota bacterium]